ncbi:hypothetical protein NQ176_g520 [Zarea fungicola]|uniref:Uncharacterized protein n=1 Tax=Zarea fungicola TaxID=93591 RepID=A0ACC1NYW4_9HYPO|nr:hypothetical protein NQ176_g520 [Lecanicillium fungicola]
MCVVHNTIYRGFNSIYQQAPHVADRDKAAFVGYCQAWIKFLHSHTEHEESGLFPMTEELLQERVFDGMHEEHEAILGPLKELETYVSQVAASPKDLSGPRLLDILDSLYPPLESHFNEEVQRIAGFAAHPNAPARGSAKEKKITEQFAKWGERSLTEPGVTDVLVFFLLNLDREHEDGLWKNWPPIPEPVRWAMVNVAGQWHRSWWKFASCDSLGKRRELYAWGSK